MIAEYSQKFDSWFEKFLWKFGTSRRKKILKFFGKWTIEDEIYEILAEEIQKEINKELIESIRKSK